MACTAQTERCFKTHDRTPLPPCCRSKITELLAFVTDILDSNGVEYWLDYGTLLGAVRSGHAIPWDDDADISIYERDIEKVISLISAHPQYRFSMSNNVGEFPQLFYSDANLLHIDIFPWYESNGYLHRREYLDSGPTGPDSKKGKGFPCEWVSKRSRIVLDGREYWAPVDPNTMCRHRYGTLWNTPMTVSEWNLTDQNKNLIHSPVILNTIDSRDGRIPLDISTTTGLMMHLLDRAVKVGPDRYTAEKRSLMFSHENRLAGIDTALSLAKPGTIAEFGVYRGATAHYLLAHGNPDRLVLFDSFDGLPEDWSMGFKKGHFKVEDLEIPRFDDQRVQIVRGLFSETVDSWPHVFDRQISLIHIDADLYSSCCTVLGGIQPYIGPGTVILFDEFFGYEGWEDGEFRAFAEFVERTSMKYSIPYRTHYMQAVVVIE